MSASTEAIEGTCNARQLAGAVISRVGYDRLVIILRKVKDQPRLNIGNVVRYSRHDGHGVMRIIGGRCLALYMLPGGFGCCDDDGVVSARCVKPDLAKANAMYSNHYHFPDNAYIHTTSDSAL